MKRILSLLLVLAGLAPFPAALAQLGSPGKEEVVIKADNSEYNDKTGEVILRGSVVLSQGGQTLSCDEARYNSDRQEATATGNVVFERNGEVWRGQKLTYNFATGQGDVNLQDVMINLQKANLSFQQMVQVRNKLVSAYHDIMNIQV